MNDFCSHTNIICLDTLCVHYLVILLVILCLTTSPYNNFTEAETRPHDARTAFGLEIERARLLRCLKS